MWKIRFCGICIALPAGLAGVAQADLTSDPALVLRLSFDDFTTVVPDLSGRGHDGTVHGDVTPFTDAGRRTARFLGTTGPAGFSYLDLNGASVPAEDCPTAAITLGAWVKCENNGGHHAIFNARALDATWVIHPELRSDGRFRWLLRAAGNVLLFDLQAGTVTWGEWLHYTGTYDKATGQAILYINQQVVTAYTVATPRDIAPNWAAGARVGYNVDSARPFTGLMDELCLFKRALSSSELDELMMVGRHLKAYAPVPPDGAVGIVSPVLTWTPGETALWHNIYLGTSPHLTAADRKMVGQAATTYSYAGGWQPGVTYYWRVDEVAADGTVYTGDLWHFVARGKTAYSPTPVDGAVIADLNPILLWEPGLGALRHQVFFGTKLEAVKAGTGDVRKATVTTPLYLPGKLEAQTTYYWRVDEIDGTQTYKGPVWSFTVATMEGFETKDFSKFPWEHGEGSRWTITSGKSHSGTYCARAGQIGDDASSSLTLTQAVRDGVVTFWCKVSCEGGLDRLEFAIDGITQGQWTGERDWEEVSFPVKAGVRTFTWTYMKDSSSASGEDTAWIDDVSLPL